MARPKIKEAKKQYTVMLKPSMADEIDKLASKVDLTRSHLMENLIAMGLDDAKLLESSGVLWIVKAGRKAYQYFKHKGNEETALK